jgi:hypothetical protein
MSKESDLSVQNIHYDETMHPLWIVLRLVYRTDPLSIHFGQGRMDANRHAFRRKRMYLTHLGFENQASDRRDDNDSENERAYVHVQNEMLNVEPTSSQEL